jgi:hypothetical protein
MDCNCQNIYCIANGKEFTGWCKVCHRQLKLSYLFSCPAKKKFDERGIEYYTGDIDEFEHSVLTTNNDELIVYHSDEDYYEYLSEGNSDE